MIPGAADLQFNLRYSPHWTADALIGEIERLLQQHGLKFELHWHRSGEPFYTREGALRTAVRSALADCLGQVPEENTGGGTSDGRFIAPLGAEVVELGPVNASIHKIDECISLQALEAMPELYRQIAQRYLSAASAAS